MTRNMPKHPSGRMDSRYSVTREWTGAPRLQFVARFCGDFIGAAGDRATAQNMCRHHAGARFAPMFAAKMFPDGMTQFTNRRTGAFALIAPVGGGGAYEVWTDRGQRMGSEPSRARAVTYAAALIGG